MTGRLTALLLACGCSLALDPDELVFPDAPADAVSAPTDTELPTEVRPGPDLGPSPDLATPEVVAPEDVTPFIDGADAEPTPDVGVGPAIVLDGAAGGTCTTSYKLSSVLGVLGQCARACSGGAVGPWTLELGTPLDGPWSWKLQATEGYVVLPKTASTQTVSATIAFEDDNCRASQSAPEFLVVVSVSTASGTSQRSFTVRPTLDGTCAAPRCD